MMGRGKGMEPMMGPGDEWAARNSVDREIARRRAAVNTVLDPAPAQISNVSFTAPLVL